MADTNEHLDTSNEEYTTVNNLTPITSIAGTERLHLQDEDDNDWTASVDEVGEHVLAHISEYQEPTYNTDNDLFPVVVSGQPAKQKLGTLSTYIANKALQSVEATVDCDSLGSAENKVITLDIIPAELHINFTHGNTYGDTTIAQPTHPSIVIQNSSAEVLATLDICDSRGHYAGTGCWNDNDTIDFQVSMTGEDTGKARIKNSDVRQAGENYIIKSDNSIIQTALSETEVPTGKKWIDGKNIYSKAFYSANNSFSNNTDFILPYAENIVNSGMLYRKNSDSFFPTSTPIGGSGASRYVHLYANSSSFTGGTLWTCEFTKTTD